MPSARVVARQVPSVVQCLQQLGPPNAQCCYRRSIPVLGIPGLHAPGIAEAPQHFGWRPPDLQKPCSTTPGKRTVVFRNGNSERLVGRAKLPELVQVLLQLAQGLLGNAPPVFSVVEATGQGVGPLPLMGLCVLWVNGGVHPVVQPSRILPG